MGIRIAIQGDIATGKSTLTQYMQSQYDWYAIEYADSLKWALCRALNYFEEETGKHFFLDDIHADKDRYRKVLQELGTAVGFDEGAGVEMAVNEWVIRRRSANQPVIFDNVRFPAQFEMLKRHGFVLVELWVNYDIRKARAAAKSIKLDTYGHAAEESRNEPDVYLNANGTIEETAELLLRLNGQRITRKAA